MTTTTCPRLLPLALRRRLFGELVALQDGGLKPYSSRLALIERHPRLTVADVARIEDEGIDENWPPLEGE